MKANDKIIYIVSGMPRCGTSMMMNILEAGGMDALHDDYNKTDPSFNPNGYYEFGLSFNYHCYGDWFDRAVDKLLKIITYWVFNLPKEYEYRVVYMYRNIVESAASYERLLKATNHRITRRVGLPKHFAKFHKEGVDFLKSSRNLRHIVVNYNEFLVEPAVYFDRISDLFECELNADAMASVIDDRLYRHRKTEHGTTYFESK